MKCRKCGSDIGPEAVHQDEKDALGEIADCLCGPCFDESWDRYLAMKEEFERLVLEGVHPRVADRIMCVKISKLEG